MRTLWHPIRVRPWLAIATALGVVASLALPDSLYGPTRALVVWDTGTGLYLGLAWIMMLRPVSVEHMRRRARLQDDGAALVLGLTLVAAVASLAAIVLELVGVRNYPPPGQTRHLLLAGATILCSWCFVHTAFALHYAHEFYVAAGRAAGPAWSSQEVARRTTSTSSTSPSSSVPPPRRPTSPFRRAPCAGSPSSTASSRSSSTRRSWP